MNAIKKYFQFNGTISGTTFFLRNLLTLLSSLITVMVIGFGVGFNSTALILIGVVLLLGVIWFSLTNTFKRINALFPESAALYTAGLFSLQCVNGAMSLTPYRIILSGILLFIGLFLIFKESNIDNHNG
jgi:uncharacterized membrane protein YhaH (DUF805 family)